MRENRGGRKERESDNDRQIEQDYRKTNKG